MNVKRLIKEIVSEEFDRIRETLEEAEQVKCEGTEEWTDVRDCITNFICYVESFNSGLIDLQDKVSNDNVTDFSQLAKNLFGIITRANNCIFKERTYGFNRSELKPKYKKPLSIMYAAKSAMGTSLLSLIMANRSQFRMVRSRLRSDELGRRLIDIIYGGKEIGRRSKLPWQRVPLLTKYRANTVKKERNVYYSMQLCSEAFDFRVKRFCRSIG